MDQRIHHEISQLVPFNMILQQPRGGTQSTGLKKIAQKRATKRWEKTSLASAPFQGPPHKNPLIRMGSGHGNGNVVPFTSFTSWREHHLVNNFEHIWQMLDLPIYRKISSFFPLHSFKKFEIQATFCGFRSSWCQTVEVAHNIFTTWWLQNCW